MHINCPNCNQAILQKTDQIENIGELFTRWENEGKINFSRQTFQEYSEDINITLYKCFSCGFKQFYPVIEGTPNFYYDITKKQYYVKDKWEFSKAISDISKMKAKNVLDVGCGSGAFLMLLKKALPELTLYGFDHNELVQHELIKNEIKLFSKLDEVDLKFDVICSFQIVEHIADPFAWLIQIRKLLKPNGYLIITVPDNAGPIRFFPKSLTELPPHHLTRWNKDSINIFLERRGFNLIDDAVEPLPDYLWDDYIPKIFKSKIPSSLHKFCEERKVVKKGMKLLRWLKKLGVSQLPVHGHTLYVIAKLQKEND